MPRTYKNEYLNATVDVDNKRIFFWGGIFSQWARCFFVDPKTKTRYNCNEQMMMAEKAKLFGDSVACEAILKNKDPREQKAIGRLVENFDAETWDKKAFGIVKYANYLKFSQTDNWRQLLLMTEDYEIVEASPEDKIWGIGLGENDDFGFGRLF